MLKKLLSILENIVIIVVAFFAGNVAYSKLVAIHANSCCRTPGACPIYACEIDSPDFYKYTLLAAAVVFCGALIIFLIFNTIKLLFKR